MYWIFTAKSAAAICLKKPIRGNGSQSLPFPTIDIDRFVIGQQQVYKDDRGENPCLFYAVPVRCGQKSLDMLTFGKEI
jgi:hypothetical protein